MALHQDLVHEALNRGTANFLLSVSIERTNYCPHSGFKWPNFVFQTFVCGYLHMLETIPW